MGPDGKDGALMDFVIGMVGGFVLVMCVRWIVIRVRR